MSEKEKHPSPISPAAIDPNLRVTPPKEVAGGVPAVTSALSLSMKQMGLLRTAEALLDVNQKRGFDCPGCAWPDPDDRRSLVEFCENGAKAVAEEATKGKIGPEFFREWPVGKLSEKADYWLSQQGRLTHPMWLPAGGDRYEPIRWDDAFLKISRSLRSADSPNEAVFYTSGRTSNEAAFLYQLFVRLYGTNNLPDCSNMCHESSGLALLQTIGTGKGTVSLEDFDHADCILVIGQNPGTNHPRMLTTLQAAARRGCAIVSINPLFETGLKQFRHPQELRGILGKPSAIATHSLPVRINGDVALLKGLMKALLELNAADRDFIARYTTGFEALERDLHAEPWGAIVDGSGISESEIREVAAVIAKSKRMICCWAMGLTQHRNAVANIQEVVNLLLLGGHLGKPGAGACPVRGHSNVQGDRTMGIYEKPSADFLAALGKEFHFVPPEKFGFDTVDSIRAMHEGRVKFFFALGGNFVAAAPDTYYTAEALRRCELTVHVSTKLNRSHLVTGREALILPCLGRTESDLQGSGLQFVSVENSMGVVHPSEGRLEPASQYLKSEVAIVCELAKATLSHSVAVDWDGLRGNYDRIRDHIARVIPGFSDFNSKIRRPGGFVLPHPVRDELKFLTADGKAHFTVHPIPKHSVGDGRYLMMTIRSHDQYNTTIYGMDDRYRGIYQGRRVVLMNAEDIAYERVKAGDVVNLLSHFGGEERRANHFVVVAYEIPRGCLATYFPEANPLVAHDNFAEGSQTPVSKSVIVSLESTQ